MRRFCYILVLLLVYYHVNARPFSDEQGPLESAGSLDWNQVPLENQLPQEYRRPENEDIDKSMLDERSQRLLLDDYNNVKLPDSEQPVDGVALQNAEAPELDDREKRSNYDDSRLDADIKRYQEILEETGKSLENSELADDERRNEAFDQSSRVKRSASHDSLDDEAEADASQDNDDVKEEGDEDSRNKESDETVAESEESNENAAELDNNEISEQTDIAEEADDANIEETEDDAAEQDVEEKEDDVDDDSYEGVNEQDADLEKSLNEVKSLDDYLEDLNEQTDELSQLRDELGSLLDVEYTPEETSRTRRQTLKHIAHENPVEYLKSLPQYKDVPRQVLTNAVQSLMQPSDEVKKPTAVEEIHEPQPAERQAVRVPKADSSQVPAAPCFTGSSDKGPQTKEEKELEKVAEMRKAEEAIVSKEQDEVIKAEHLAHTMQEDLHDVMREIRALKVEISAERKDAEKVSIETKEAQKDLEMHDERKYNARRKVDELYLRLTDLESDTCDNRNKRRVLERYVDPQHYVLARRRRMLKDIQARQQKEHQEMAPPGNGATHEQSNARLSGDVQPAHKADEMAQVVMVGQQLASAPADSQAVARQAQPCEAAPQQNEAKKKDEEYNNILQQIIIGEAQVKVEDVQVARAEEEAVSLHRRLSNVLSKLAALSIEMKNLQAQAQVSGKRAKEAQAELAYHDQVLFNARKKVNAARNLESDLLRAITDQRMNAKAHCSSTLGPPT